MLLNKYLGSLSTLEEKINRNQYKDKNENNGDITYEFSYDVNQTIFKFNDIRLQNLRREDQTPTKPVPSQLFAFICKTNITLITNTPATLSNKYEVKYFS